MPSIKILTILGCMTLLQACGGGGSGTTGTPIVNPPPPPSGDTVTISGKVTYDLILPGDNGLDYSNIIQEPAKEITVQAIRTNSTTVLASTTTNPNGNYSFDLEEDTAFFIRARAELVRSTPFSWNFQVVDNTNGGALYAIDSSALDSGSSAMTVDLNADSGWNGASYASTRAAAPFAIIDSIRSSARLVLDVDSDAQFPELTINWSRDNRNAVGDEAQGEIGTSFFRRSSKNGGTVREIFLLGEADVDTDEYDRHIIAHEWGHYFEDTFARSDSVGGQHGEGDILDMRVAFSEGFGYAFAGMALDDAVTRDTLSINQSFTFRIDVEENDHAVEGWYSEASIQSIMYDLFDDNDDGIDSISLGFQPIHDALVANQNSDQLTSIFTFIDELKNQNSNASSNIDTLLGGQDIDSITDSFGTGENNNGGRAFSLPVYKTLTVGSSQSVTTTGGEDSGDFFNKLANRAFLTFTVPTSGNYRIVATGPVGSDPDFFHYQRGIQLVDQNSDLTHDGEDELNTGSETMDVFLTAGDYVLEIYEFSNVGFNEQNRRGLTDFTVSLSSI